MVDLDAVAALLLGHVAGAVRRTQHLRQRQASLPRFTRPMLTPMEKDRVLPDEGKSFTVCRSSSREAQAHCLQCSFEQHAEFVASQPRKRVAFAQARAATER